MTLSAEELARETWDRDERASIRADPTYSRAELRSVMSLYARELQALGDPRGDLIALDLTNPAHESVNRRRELLTRWLGERVATDRSVRSSFGLVSISVSPDSLALLQSVLTSDAGRFLEAVRISGDDNTINIALREVASEARPWLGRLGIYLQGRQYLFRSTTLPLVNHDLLRRLIDAAPYLHTLEVCGPGLLREFPHGRVLRLVVDGYNSIGSLSGDGSALSSVAELDFAFHVHGDELEPLESALLRLLPVSHFQGLRRLDLSRNEPGYSKSIHLGGRINAYQLINNISISSQLTHLRMPALRTANDAYFMQEALDAMPALIEASVRACYVVPAPVLNHPTARLQIPDSFPWLPLDDDVFRRYRFEIEANGVSHAVDMADAISLMEADYSSFDETTQLAWRQFWYTFRRLQHASSTAASVTLLQSALAGSFELRSDGWRQLAASVSRLKNTDAVVTIRRLAV